MLLSLIAISPIEGAVYRNIFVDTDYLSAKVLNDTQFKNWNFNSIHCNDRRVEFTKRKIPLLERPSDDPTET